MSSFVVFCASVLLLFRGRNCKHFCIYSLTKFEPIRCANLSCSNSSIYPDSTLNTSCHDTSDSKQKLISQGTASTFFGLSIDILKARPIDH